MLKECKQLPCFHPLPACHCDPEGHSTATTQWLCAPGAWRSIWPQRCCMGRHSKAHRKRPADQDAAAAAKASAMGVKQTPAAAAAQPSEQPHHMQPTQQPQARAQAKSTFPRQADLPSPAAPPSNKHLAAHVQTLPALLESAYWTSVCPVLHCSDAADSTAAAGSRGAGTSGSSNTADTSEMSSSFDLPGERLADLRQQVDHAGVAQASML